jgi:hypothetical protein
MDYKDLRSIQETYNAMYSEEVVDEGKYSSGSVTYVKGTAPVRATYGGKTETFPKETYKKKGMVRTAEEVEEVAEEGLAGMIDKATKAGQAGLERMGVKINRAPKPTARPSVRTQDTMRQNKTSMEEVDVFDIVKGHLIDDHNLSEDVALHLMTILDEEIKADILEYTAQMRADAAPKGATMKITADGKEPVGDRILRGIKDRVGGFLRNLNPKALKSKTNEAYVVTAADKAGNTPAYQNYLKGMKNKKTGEPLYKAAPHLKGV